MNINLENFNEQTSKKHKPINAYFSWVIIILITTLASTLIFISIKNIDHGSQTANVFEAIDSTDQNQFFTTASEANLSEFSTKLIKSQADAKEIKRYKVVESRVDLINPYGKNKDSINLSLFDGQTITIDKQKIETRGRNNYTWQGKIRGHKNSEAILTVVNGYLTGTLILIDDEMRPKSNYDIISAGNNLYLVREIDQAILPSELDPIIPTQDTTPEPLTTNSTSNNQNNSKLMATAIASAQTTTPTIIDILVVYSNQTAIAAGEAINSQIQNAIDITNMIYANSGVTSRLRLVASEHLNYNERGTGSTVYNNALNDITLGANGAEAVPTLQNNYKADLVNLFIENGSLCGIGWLNSSLSRTNGKTVVNRACAGAGKYSLAHEIGHNMQSNHDIAAEPSLTPKPYGHGYVDPSCAFRTVMAYASSTCGSGKPTRIPYHSNPNMTYSGTQLPLGTTNLADTVRLLNENANTVANFFTATTASTCTHTPPTITISPTQNSGSAGESLNYQVNLTNNDNTSCISSTYTVNPTLPTDFSQTPNNLSFDLAPGAQSSQMIVITSNSVLNPNTYTITETATNPTGTLIASADATYNLTLSDTEDPIVSITNPQPNQKISGTNNTKIDITATASDDNLATISISINNKFVKSCTQVTSCTYQWQYSKIKTGSNTITASAVDKANNSSSTSITITK